MTEAGGRGSPDEAGEGKASLRTTLARYLRQRGELGAPDLVLRDLSRQKALAHARSAPRSEASPAPKAPPASGGGQAVQRPKREAPPPPRRGAPASPPSWGPPSAASSHVEAESGESPELPVHHDALRDVASACTRCRLAEGRTQVVFHDGNPNGRVMVVGEAPGANEDRTGLPFVGQAGKLLDLLLASVGLSRKHSVYISNVVKCRPPGNRDPRPDEIEACAPYLRRQIEQVQPEALLALGTFAGKLLSGEDLALGRLRGEVHQHQGVPLVVTYHPAALLRNAGWTRASWEDLQLLRQVLDAAEAA